MMRPGIKLFLHDDKAGGLFGDGKYRLLLAIKEHGSLQEAAKSLGRGYRKAWGDIRKSEKALGRKLVKRARGGRAGGSSELTEFGIKVLDAWKEYRVSVKDGMGKAYERYLRELIEGGTDDR